MCVGFLLAWFGLVLSWFCVWGVDACFAVFGYLVVIVFCVLLGFNIVL